MPELDQNYKNNLTNKIKLGVNVDHVATLRQNRHTRYPDPVHAALMAEEAGADGITVHLREDRRHIQEQDVRRMAEVICTRLNLEMAVTPEMLKFAKEIKPAYCCLVPEKRQELTTEGGLDVIGAKENIKKFTEELLNLNIQVSLFIDPEIDQINAAYEVGAKIIELHTGSYAEAESLQNFQRELERLKKAALHAASLGLIVNAGHGLHYHNVQDLIKNISHLHELNIGHAIVARAMFVGMHAAVREMKNLL